MEEEAQATGGSARLAAAGYLALAIAGFAFAARPLTYLWSGGGDGSAVGYLLVGGGMALGAAVCLKRSGSALLAARRRSHAEGQ